MATAIKGTSRKAVVSSSALPAGPQDAGAGPCELRLYVAGQTPRSTAAIANLRAICDDHLGGRYTLEVTDLMHSPHLAARDRIVAIPTLVRLHPLPRVRVIGDLSDTDRVLACLCRPSVPSS